MISDDTKDDIENILECPVCLDAAPNRTLPCGHSICEVCATEIKATSYNLKCPICNQVHNCVGAALPGLPIKALAELKALVDNDTVSLTGDREVSLSFFTSAQPDTCGFCSQKQAVYFCSDCQMYLCRPCTVRHTRSIAVVGVMKPHTISPCVAPPLCRFCGAPAIFYDNYSEFFLCSECSLKPSHKSGALSGISTLMNMGKKLANSVFDSPLSDNISRLGDPMLVNKLGVVREANNILLANTSLACAVMRDRFSGEYQNALVVAEQGVKRTEKRLDMELQNLDERLTEVEELLEMAGMCGDEDEILLKIANMVDWIEDTVYDTCAKSGDSMEAVPRVCVDAGYIPIGGQPVGLASNRVGGLIMGLNVIWGDKDNVKRGVIDGIDFSAGTLARVHCEDGSWDFVSPVALLGSGVVEPVEPQTPVSPDTFKPLYKDHNVQQDVVESILNGPFPVGSSEELKESMDHVSSLIEEVSKQLFPVAEKAKKRMPYHIGQTVELIARGEGKITAETVGRLILKKSRGKIFKVFKMLSEFMEVEVNGVANVSGRVVGKVVMQVKEEDLLVVVWFDSEDFDETDCRKCFITPISLSALSESTEVDVIPYVPNYCNGRELSSFSITKGGIKTVAVDVPVRRNLANWKFGDQDGGEGSVGQILFAEPDSKGKDSIIWVRWKNGTINRYRPNTIEYVHDVQSGNWGLKAIMKNVMTELENINDHLIAPHLRKLKSNMLVFSKVANTTQLVFKSFPTVISKFLMDTNEIPSLPYGAALRTYNAKVGYLVIGPNGKGRIVDVIGSIAVVMWENTNPSDVNLTSNEITIGTVSEGEIESKVGGYDLVPLKSGSLAVPTAKYKEWKNQQKKHTKVKPFMVGVATRTPQSEQVTVRWTEAKVAEVLPYQLDGVPLIRLPTLVDFKRLILENQNISKLKPVVRGPCWHYDNQDGGPGSIGRITFIDSNEKCVWVQWKKNKEANKYSGGAKTYDLCFLD